jgi:hypothetical protein
VIGTSAWQILYLSTTALGAPTAVSSTVIVPTTPYPGTRPLAAYAAGTQGWGPQCAPSKEIVAGDFDEQFAVNNLLAKGWAVVVTDYPGQGGVCPAQHDVLDPGAAHLRRKEDRGLHRRRREPDQRSAMAGRPE